MGKCPTPCKKGRGIVREGEMSGGICLDSITSYILHGVGKVCHDAWYEKTRTTMIYLAVLTGFTSVTDGRTDRQNCHSISPLHICRAVIEG